MILSLDTTRRHQSQIIISQPEVWHFKKIVVRLRRRIKSALPLTHATALIFGPLQHE